jgi:hypothetical protein
MRTRRLRIFLFTLAIAAVASPASVLAADTDGLARAKHYANCTALNRDYPHGVGKVGAVDHVSSGKPVKNFYRSDALYGANSRSDRDHDNVACEQR